LIIAHSGVIATTGALVPFEEHLSNECCFLRLKEQSAGAKGFQLLFQKAPMGMCDRYLHIQCS